jgi:hypothetical protein
MNTVTKMMLAATVAISGISATTAANAAIVITVTEVGTDVRADGSGTADTTGATMYGSTSGSATIRGSLGILRVGTGSYNIFAATGPSAFGSGSTVKGSAVLGSVIGVDGVTQTIMLSTGYISNSFISSTATFANQTLASLGLTPGSYVYSLPNDTVTVNIGPVAAAVPETATWAMMITGFGMMGAAMRTRRRSTKVTFS